MNRTAKKPAKSTSKRELPEIIPPRSVFRLVRSDSNTPAWGKEVGKTVRIGYYSEQDGLDVIWLVNEKGKYDQTSDRDFLLKYFEPVRITRETNLYGEGEPQFRPLRRKKVHR